MRQAFQVLFLMTFSWLSYKLWNTSFLFQEKCEKIKFACAPVEKNAIVQQ